MDEIITFELALSAFVIAMFLIMTWLYPTEEAATDALYKKQVNDYYQQRINPLPNETLCRGVPEYIDDTPKGWDSVENAKQTDDDDELPW